MSKIIDVSFVLLLVWLIYYECSKPLRPKHKSYATISRRLRRMLKLNAVPKLCARHLPNERGKMSIVDAKNCAKCRGNK